MFGFVWFWFFCFFYKRQKGVPSLFFATRKKWAPRFGKKKKRRRRKKRLKLRTTTTSSPHSPSPHHRRQVPLPPPAVHVPLDPALELLLADLLAAGAPGVTRRVGRRRDRPQQRVAVPVRGELVLRRRDVDAADEVVAAVGREAVLRERGVEVERAARRRGGRARCSCCGGEEEEENDNRDDAEVSNHRNCFFFLIVEASFPALFRFSFRH